MCFRSKPFRHIHTSWPVVAASQCWCTSKQYTLHLHHQCNNVHIDVIRCGAQDSSSQTKTKVIDKRVLEPKQAQSPFDIVGVARAVDTTLGLRRLRLRRLLTWNKHVTKCATLPRFHVFCHWSDAIVIITQASRFQLDPSPSLLKRFSAALLS